MSLKRFFCFSAFLLVLVKSNAQVNLQTGSATFSLPMFNWQDDKSRLTTVVALSYNSGNGLRVGDVASEAGQGWGLLAGGVITRLQVGEPDDQYPSIGTGDHSEHDLTKYPAGMLFAPVPTYYGCPNALNQYPLYKSKNQLYAQHNVVAADRELDYFSFQFNGKAGQFVVDPTDIGNCKSLGDTKMKITFQQDASLISQGIRTRITSFTIQDEDGLIYKFAQHALTKVLKLEYCDASLNYKQSQPKIKSYRVYHQTGFEEFVNPWIISGWYLTEIKDPLTNSTVSFVYTLHPATNVAGADITYNWEKNYATVVHKKSITQSPQIVSINCPDGHSVVFNYGGWRIDLNGSRVLTSIDIKYNGRFLSEYKLNTSYFILNRYGTPTSDFQRRVARLCLLSVQKIGVDLKEDTPPYIFDYYLGSNASDDFVPPPFSYAKDIWGFFNGNNTHGYYSSDPNDNIPLTLDISQLESHNWFKGLCFLRDNNGTLPVLNAKAGYAKNGLLRQIIYPTGGTLTYEYEQNYGLLNGVNKMWGGVHVSKTLSTDGGYSNGCNNPISTQYNYVMNGVGSDPSLWGLEMPVNSVWSASHYDPKDKKYHWTWSCAPFGCCYYKYFYPGIISQQQAINLNTFQKIMEIASPVLGIISVVSTIVDIATLIGASNPGPATIAAVIIDIICGLITIGVTCLTNYSQDPSATVYYNTDFNGISPLPAQFKRVEIVENPGTIGKTVQEFTSSDDYAVWHPTNPRFSAKQRFAPWAYGLPKRTLVMDASGNPVKETKNIYNFLYAKNTIDYCSNHGMSCNLSGVLSNLVSCKCDVIQNYSQRQTDWNDWANNSSNWNNSNNYVRDQAGSDIKADFYAMYSGRTLLDTTIERIFKMTDPSQYVETFTTYMYNETINYQPYAITTKESNGNTIEKLILYAGNYSGGPLTTLLNNNIVNVPVESSTRLIKPNYSYYYLGESVTEFTQLPNGDVKPLRTLEQRFAQPATSITTYGGPGSNTSNYKETQTFSYYDGGNIATVKDEGNRIVSNIYGYNEKYVVASIINSELFSDHSAYASFEETATWAGWTLQITSGTVTYSNSSVTGARSLILTPYISLTTNINSSKAYTVSFWASNSSTYVSAVSGTATLVKSAPTFNGFTYYEYDISAGSTYVTVAGGNANLDEVRLYPKNARMRSVSYDPAIGKTSECDENNRITYYEYDNLGRLRFVKDEKRNIVKMYEYNNVSATKQNGCPGTYYNHMISETFRKQCGPGYIGTEVTYTVAANIFSSTISQADADAQAEHYVLTYGQGYANTNGSCVPLYCNIQLSQNFTTECEQEGYVGGTVPYTVPAGRYCTTYSQDSANQMALDEIEANGQANANDPANAICTPDQNPDWQWEEGGATQCQMVNGEMHLMLWATDMNPNSSTYGQSSWQDSGPSTECPPGGDVTLYYENWTGMCQYITLTNANTYEQYFYFVYAGGGMGILGSVPAGNYNIEITPCCYYCYYLYFSVGCGISTTGYTAYFWNIPLNETCNFIQISY